MAEQTRPFETSWMWMVKIITGILVAVVLFVHLVVNHLVAEGGLLSYVDVVRYLSNPWIAVMEGTFLILVVAHSLTGVRGIILDLNPTPKVIKWIDLFLGLLGMTAAIYGIWLLWVIIK